MHDSSSNRNFEIEPQPLPGTNYLLIEKIGEGGGGSVYIGKHLELDKEVAIKVLHYEYSFDPLYQERFRREAQLASKIQHPYIVSVTDFGKTSDGRLFLVMELVKGETLKDRIALGPIPLRDALKIALNLCKALSVVHSYGIIHRDVKPANLFLLPNNEIKLVDFGIAKQTILEGDKGLTKTGYIHGTPGYIAPETARDTKLDHRADLYSVGVILYEMLSGSNPFPQNSPIDVLIAQLESKYEPLSSKVSFGVWTEKIEQIIEKAMQVDPKDRFSDAEEFAKELELLLEELELHNGTTTFQRKKDSKGKRLIVSLVMLVVVVILLSIAILLGVIVMGKYKGKKDLFVFKNLPNSNSKRILIEHDNEGKKREVVVEKSKTVVKGEGEKDQEKEKILQVSKVVKDEFSRVPTKGLPLKKRLEILIEKKEYIRAIELAEKLVKDEPSSVEYRMILGDLYRRMGRIKDAVRVYLEVIKLDPGNEKAKRYLEIMGYAYE